MNMQAVERTRMEIERMRDRQEREQRVHDQHLIEAAQRECNRYRELNLDLDNQNKCLVSRLTELEQALEGKRREV